MTMKFPTHPSTTMWEIRTELRGRFNGVTRVAAHPESELVTRFVVLHVAANETQSAVEVGGDVEGFYPGSVHTNEQGTIIVEEATVISIAPMFAIDHTAKPLPEPKDT